MVELSFLYQFLKWRLLINFIIVANIIYKYTKKLGIFN